MPAPSPIELMRRETQVHPGAVGTQLGGIDVPVGDQVLVGDEFLLRGPGFSFHYRKGRGITVAREAGADPADERLHLNGSVYAAVACINGFLPIHASAVAVDGQVIAFTAPAGGGKSTLVAGLTQLGLPLFCDDTLVLDISPGGRVLCLPGHKRLKLWPDAVELTGATALDQVSRDYAKFYVTPSGGDVAEVLPLGALVFLEAGAAPAVLGIDGGEKIMRLKDDHYTRDMFDKVHRPDLQQRFALHARIASQVRMARFVRPIQGDTFRETTRYLADRLCSMVTA